MSVFLRLTLCTLFLLTLCVPPGLACEDADTTEQATGAETVESASSHQAPTTIEWMPVTGMDIVYGARLDFFKFRVPATRGSNLTVSMAHQNHPDGETTLLFEFKTKVISEANEAHVLLAFVPKDRKMGPVIRTDHRESILTIHCHGCYPRSRGGLMDTPLSDIPGHLRRAVPATEIDNTDKNSELGIPLLYVVAVKPNESGPPYEKYFPRVVFSARVSK